MADNYFKFRVPDTKSISSSQKVNEKKYSKAMKQLDKLNEKYKRFNNDNDPNRVKRNILISRGRKLLRAIDRLEQALDLKDGEKVNPNKFFVD